MIGMPVKGPRAENRPVKVCNERGKIGSANSGWALSIPSGPRRNATFSTPRIRQASRGLAVVGPPAPSSDFGKGCTFGKNPRSPLVI